MIRIPAQRSGRPPVYRVFRCAYCRDWGTLVAPGGHGLTPCPYCRPDSPATGHGSGPTGPRN